MSVDSSVLGKRMGYFDAFDDFMQSFGRDDHKAGPFKPQSKRPTIPASSRLFGNDRDNFLIPTPTRPASSSFGMPSPAPKLSMPALSSFGIQSPPKFVCPIKPAASVPASAPSVIAAPSTEAATPKPHDTSDLCRDVKECAEKLDQDNDDIGCKEGGVRFRENLGKFVVEYRPPRFKWKLWMGTYATVDEGRRACDCARFYAGQDKGGFYFKDSPALFSELGPLNRPFSLVSKDVKDKAFNVELKKRAKQVIRKVLDAQRAKQSVDVARPSVKIPLPDAIVQQVVLGARTANRDTNRDTTRDSNCDNFPSPSQESPLSSGVFDPAHEENEVAEESAQREVASAADAADPYASLDPFTNPGSLPEQTFDYLSGVVFTAGFNIMPDIPFPSSGCNQSSLDFADDLVGDVIELWNHDC